jgi:uncharacterized protein YndB with AHSA1/START domain
LGYPFDNLAVVNHHSNQSVVKEAEMAERIEERAAQRATTAARTEVEIEATPEEVWEALVTEEGRETWLAEPDRDVYVEVVQAPSRLVWWWTGEDEPATRVEFQIVAVPGGTRVVVTESEPAFPISLLARSFAPAPAGSFVWGPA